MSCSFGNNLKITIFGQSHSEKIGVVIDRLPAGIKIDTVRIAAFLERRAPGRSGLSTRRNEDDAFEIVSGLYNGFTCGAPLCAYTANKDTRSEDYESLAAAPRPSHSDYPAGVKYNGFNDIRGGGNFSGRMTAPLCFAGAVCIQLLESMGVFVGAHISSIGEVFDMSLDPVNVNPECLRLIAEKTLPVVDDECIELMADAITEVKAQGDSLGGTVECAVVGLKPGVGEPMFDGLENRISATVFAIPGVKGIEFGSGFDGTLRKGSQNNDPYCYNNGVVKTSTNNAGGILGGLSTGMPVIFRCAFKPTPSIAAEQCTVNTETGEEVKISVPGRHDPCIVPRAVPCVEAAAAIAVADFLIKG